MPFSKAEDLKKEDLDYIYTHILKKAVEEFEIDGKRYFQRVERFENKVGSIISGIVNNLNTAELVIADLTGLNPNVMYELGVRHALKRGTIIISQNMGNLPSDLRDYLTVDYTYSQKTTEQPDCFEKFKSDLHKTIVEVISTNKYDSPVLSYLEQKQRFRDEEKIERLKENAIVIEAIHNEYFAIEEMVSTLIENNYQGIENRLMYQLFNLKLNSLTVALSELNIPYSSSILYEQITNSRTILSEVNKMFGMNEYFDSFKQIEGFPTGAFGTSDIKGCIERQFVNVFVLSEGGGLKYTNMKELFKEEGVLQDELLDYLQEFISEKAKDLGVEEDEINKVLES